MPSIQADRIHKVISPTSSCMFSRPPSPQARGLSVRIKRAMCHIHAKSFFLAVLSCLLAGHMACAQAQTTGNIERRLAGSLTAMPTENLAVSGAFYVPVYSSVSMSQGKLQADFSVTLSIHNASETRPLVLKRIAYFDTSGIPVESYLTSPIALKPFA